MNDQRVSSLATSFKVSTGQSRDVILERKPDFEVNTERVVNSQNPEFENSEPICGSIGKYPSYRQLYSTRNLPKF